jgi:Fe-S cluster assembly scaffold protein SufB
MDEALDKKLQQNYTAGFTTDVESETLPPGLNEDTIRQISKIKQEPEWLLQFRLRAYDRWKILNQPNWSNLEINPIDYQAISYYSAPKKGPASYDEVDPEIKKDFEKLGIPLNERAALAGVAVDAVFDSVSVATTFRKDLEKLGIIFCSFSEAVKNCPELVKKYLGSVIPISDHSFAALNSAGKGGIYNFVTKRGKCKGRNSKITWTQFETGSRLTWKYPSCLLLGDNSVGEFYSVALTNGMQQADTGTKMIHIGKNTKSTIISKGISAGKSHNTYRGEVKIMSRADNSKNYTQCDSLMMGSKCKASTIPYIINKNATSNCNHEATTSKLDEEQLFYAMQRGIKEEDSVNMIVSGFCKDVFQKLPLEFAVEANKLLEVSMEGSVG